MCSLSVLNYVAGLVPGTGSPLGQWNHCRSDAHLCFTVCYLFITKGSRDLMLWWDIMLGFRSLSNLFTLFEVRFAHNWLLKIGGERVRKKNNIVFKNLALVRFAQLYKLIWGNYWVSVWDQTSLELREKGVNLEVCGSCKKTGPSGS